MRGMEESSLPEPQSWLGATWLASLHSVPLAGEGLNPQPLYHCCIAGACPREGLLKAAEFSSYSWASLSSPTPKSWHRLGLLSPHCRLDLGRAYQLLVRLNSYGAAERSPGTCEDLPQGFLGFPLQASQPGG